MAGSSLFPTGGWANPTLTIVALALRSAETDFARTLKAMTAVAPVGAQCDPALGADRGGAAAADRPGAGAGACAPDGEVLVNLGLRLRSAWLKLVAARPGLVVTRGGVPVLAHCRGGLGDEIGGRWSEARSPLAPSAAKSWPGKSAGDLENEELRKKERPFMERLAPETVRGARAGELFRRL